MAYFPWVSVLLPAILSAVSAGAVVVFIATMLRIIYRLWPLEDDSRLGWSERMGRRNARFDPMWIGPEFARERRLLAWSFGVATATMALLGLLALIRS